MLSPIVEDLEHKGRVAVAVVQRREATVDSVVVCDFAIQTRDDCGCVGVRVIRTLQVDGFHLKHIEFRFDEEWSRAYRIDSAVCM